MFLSQEDFATVVRSTPLISIDLVVENERGEFLLGQRTNRPAQGYWFVPGGRVQKDETLENAFARLTQAELGLRLPMTAGQFYGVWQHFYDDNFSGIGFTSFRFVGFLSLSLVGTIIARLFRFVNSNNYLFYYYFVNKL